MKLEPRIFLPPKKEVLEGEVVGSKSKKYMDLQKQMDEATNPDLRAARELNMETQGVQDAFDLNAANNIDKNFDFASGGDEVRSTSDEFIDGVIDEFQGARDIGFSRGEALVDAVRVKVKDYNDIYPDALDVNSVLDDIAKNVNDDFGFDDALSRFREGRQTGRLWKIRPRLLSTSAWLKSRRRHVVCRKSSLVLQI